MTPTQNLKNRIGPNAALEHIVYVAKNGSDSEGTGEDAAPFLTIKYALSTITDNDATHRYIIQVGPGVYSEDNPLVMKDYVNVVGSDGPHATRINASNAASDLITGSVNCEVDGFTLADATAASLIHQVDPSGVIVGRNLLFLDAKYGVTVNHATTAVNLYDCVARTTPVTGSMDILFNATAGAITAYNTFVVLNADIETLVKADGATASVGFIGLSSQSTNVVNGAYADNGAMVAGSSSRMMNATYGIRVGAGNGSIQADNCWFDSGTYDLYVEGAAAVVHCSSTTLDRDKFSIAAGALVYLYGHDRESGGFRVLQDMAVGMDGTGHKLNTGEGGPYLYHTKIKTWSGAAFADIADGDNISFPNVNANSAIYFGDVDSFSFFGIGYLMGATPINLGGGSIVWEYYDGGSASWLAFGTLNTLGGFSNTTANVSFGGTNAKNYTVRFDQEIATGVKESDAGATGWAATTVDGQSAKWIRCRIAVGITTSPVFASPRMKGNYSEFRANGTKAFHGEARSNSKFISEQGVNRGQAANQQLNVSTNINFRFSENELANGATDIIYFKILITEQMDTSSGIRVEFELCTDVSPGGGAQTAKLHFYQSQMKEGDTFDGSAAEVEQAFDFVAGNGDAAFLSQRIVMTDRIDISGLVPGDMVYCTLERETDEVGDDLAGYVALSNLFYEVREWEDGSVVE